jgi:hypothetical protein
VTLLHLRTRTGLFWFRSTSSLRIWVCCAFTNTHFKSGIRMIYLLVWEFCITISNLSCFAPPRGFVWCLIPEIQKEVTMLPGIQNELTEWSDDTNSLVQDIHWSLSAKHLAARSEGQCLSPTLHASLDVWAQLCSERRLISGNQLLTQAEDRDCDRF